LEGGAKVTGVQSRDITDRFGANLTRIRKRANLSQEEVGFAADLHRTEVGMLERGIRLPRLDTIAKLAGALEIDPGDLFAGITWRSGAFTPGRFELSDRGGGGEEEAAETRQPAPIERAA
jgi:transcriptional regulator with XRE-family HTH domain